VTTYTTTDTALGDRVPTPVADYYLALDEGRFGDAVAPFSEDVRYAVPPPGVIETAPRLETRGREALLHRFEERGHMPWVHEILLCAVEGRTCMVEGLSRSAETGEAAASFVASMEIDERGITRYLAYVTYPAVVPLPADTVDGGAAGGSPDGLQVLERYFHALDAGAFDDAAACFSDDVVYSHPPYKHTGLDGSQRVEFNGREELLEKFRQRGPQTFDHRLLACIQRGPHCLVEGLVEGLPDGRSGSFISSFTLDRDGLIRRYLSFYCEPSVPVA
jgi:3-phenylpropionate/cinnamic acid dioxygenase small subunit